MKFSVEAIAYDRHGRVLAIGRNSYTKTHPVQAKYAERAGFPKRIYLHAEIDALIKAKAQVYKLSVIRVGKDGRTRLAKPCPVCELAINNHRVKLVEYTT